MSAVAETEQSLELDDLDSDEEPELFFEKPEQLLNLFAELEEQNLSLIQNSQETEESLEEVKHLTTVTMKKMEKETEFLMAQIESLKSAISKEEEKSSDLELRTKMFCFGEFKADDQEKMLSDLNKKVEVVYKNCMGDNEANITTLQMLTNIENRMEELFQSIELMPPDKVEAAEKAKEKERRFRLREEKLEEQKRHQEERVRKALARAQAEPNKQTGRRLIFRSAPPQLKKKDDKEEENRNREEEEYAYYFR